MANYDFGSNPPYALGHPIKSKVVRSMTVISTAT
jgi:hypothetical protein